MSKKRLGACALAVAFSAALSVPVFAASPEAILLEQETAAKVPSNWLIHVSPRDKSLVVFLMPPYQEAFNLWYEPEKLHAKMLALCPGPNDAIWGKLPPEEGVSIEPTVGGKSDVAMRIACKRFTPPPA